jgi:hypothetical protein
MTSSFLEIKLKFCLQQKRNDASGIMVDCPVTQVNDFGPSGFNLYVHNIPIKSKGRKTYWNWMVVTEKCYASNQKICSKSNKMNT